MKEGWLCPSCGSAHSPDTATCPTASRVEQPASRVEQRQFHINPIICCRCGKKQHGLSIPSIGLIDFDVCQCLVEGQKQMDVYPFCSCKGMDPTQGCGNSRCPRYVSLVKTT